MGNDLVLAIDPGPIESGWAILLNGSTVARSGKSPNAHIRHMLRWQSHAADIIAIEMIESFGMPVGAEVFETVLWIGRFCECCTKPDDVRLVRRSEVKKHLCHAQVGVSDAHIRQRLIDLLGAPGTKKSPGPTFGVKGDAWQALAVAKTARDLARST